MKAVTLLLIFHLSLTLFCQDKYNYYEITILSGAGYFGVTKIQLQYEGLFCRSFIGDGATYKEKTSFIKMKNLDYSKVLQIYSIIHDSVLMDVDSIIKENSSLTSPSYYMRIRLFDLIEDECYFIKYRKYNKTINELIVLLNDLVPDKYKRHYQIKNWVYNRWVVYNRKDEKKN